MAQPLDTTVRIVTPENIAFDYRLAGPFRRLPALLIDGMVIGLTLLLVSVAGAMLYGVGLTGIGGLLLPVVFAVVFFYGSACEILFNGQTAGKASLGLRTVSVDGVPVTAQQSILRYFLLIADLAFFGAVAAAAMLLSGRLQRLGDLFAGTMVVIDERDTAVAWADVDDDPDAVPLPLPASLRGDPELTRALGMYMQRRPLMSASRRQEIALRLAGPLGQRLRLPEDTDPDRLLCALARFAMS